MNQPAGRPQPARALVAFFILCYITNGLGDYDNGLLIQPLTFYLKQALGWNSDQAATYLGALAIPWMITPLYSAFSEFVPIFGYRHKSYIILMNVILVGAYLALMGLTNVDLMLIALLASAVTTAVSTTLCGAIMIASSKTMEGGQAFVDIQWTFYYAGIAAASFVGGWLAQQLAPESALHAAAGIMVLTPLAVLIGAWAFLPRERQATVNMAGFKESLAAMRSTFKVRVLWIIGLFLVLFNFSPGFQTPLYYQMTDNLGFSQQFTGFMSALMAVGSVIGGIICAVLEKRVSLKAMLYLSIAFGVIAQGSYVFLSSQTSAVILSLMYGCSAMLSLVSALTFAARYCPDGAEGFAYAILVCVSNASYQLSDQLGSVLYEHVFGHNLTPLIIITCLFTAAAAGVLPLLKTDDRENGGSHD